MIRYAIFFLLASTLRLSAQEKFWIYFTDKGSNQHAMLRKSYEASNASARFLAISDHAMARRALRGAGASFSRLGRVPEGGSAERSIVDEEDLPVAQEYLSALRTQMGIRPIIESRWLNAVSARLTPEERERVLRMPGVRSVEPVRVYRSDSLMHGEHATGLLEKTPPPARTVSSIDYGVSYPQLQQINVPLVHSLDITGRGVIVGMLDSGFRWRMHESLKNSHVIAEYDFIQHDTVTSNEPGDAANQDDHGTKTMSTLGGYMPGQLVGPAFEASFLLAKTEYVPQELNSEEDNWVAGLEWLERNGADIVSSSLGYSDFDPGQRSYSYQDMNGHTAVTTRAAAVAARKGVFVCVAMGNEGDKPWHYLTSPADADSILSVGAVSGSGIVAGFSSVGPTSDGRTKPDVCARGVNDICAAPSATSQSVYVFNSGTSLATPLAAGAAALVLSARPELTPIELRDALRETASNALFPNYSIGWGVIDAFKALMHKGLLISAELTSAASPDSSRQISVRIISAFPLVSDSLLYHYSIDTASSFITGRLALQSLSDSLTHSGVYTFALPKHAKNFYLSASDRHGDSRLLPFNAPGTLYDAKLLSVQTPKDVPQSYVLEQNFPNPFNGLTTIRYAITRPSRVSIIVRDILGREIARLVNEDKPPGSYSVAWNAGSGSASGVYFYTIRTNEFSETKKMVLVR